MFVVADRQRRRFVQAGRIPQRALDQVIEQRDRDVVEQQRADGFVHAAVGAQRAGRSPSIRRPPSAPATSMPDLHRRRRVASGRPPRPPPDRRAPSRPRRPSRPARGASGSAVPARSASAAPPAAACSGTRTRCRTRRGTSPGRRPAGCGRSAPRTAPNSTSDAAIAAPGTAIDSTARRIAARRASASSPAIAAGAGTPGDRRLGDRGGADAHADTHGSAGSHSLRSHEPSLPFGSG